MFLFPSTLNLDKEIKYGLNISNPFCKDPLSYIFKTDLFETCDFEDIFIKTARNILADGSKALKAQGHLTNGIQTAGDIFLHEEVCKTDIENIIHTEIDRYRFLFNDSDEGFIKNFKVEGEEKKPVLSMELKYHSGNPVISNFERVSKPGRRIFSSADSLPKINNGLGIAIVSTPKGVMTDMDARKQKIGGEIICKVF